MSNRFSSHMKKNEFENKILKPTQPNPQSKKAKVVEKAKVELM